MLISIIRTFILYALILAAMRLMGKRQIRQMQTSELVATIMLSELAVSPIQNYNEPLINGIAPMLVLVVLEIIVALIMMKSDKFRQLLCGKPIVVIEDGTVKQDSLKKLRMTTEELSENLRQNGSFFLDEVSYAIIETNGIMSVLRKTEEDFVTPRILKVSVKEKPLEVIVVTDGVLAKSSIDVCGQTPSWVLGKIAENKLDISDVFIMTASRDGNYRIIKKDKAEK